VTTRSRDDTLLTSYNLLENALNQHPFQLQLRESPVIPDSNICPLFNSHATGTCRSFIHNDSELLSSTLNSDFLCIVQRLIMMMRARGEKHADLARQEVSRSLIRGIDDGF
jgi:hypothetical protein